MTPKRTHGPCTCKPKYSRQPGRQPVATHHLDCPALYPAPQEPDALTRLVRMLRSSDGAGWDVELALSLISEAREEQRQAVAHAENNGLERARKMASFEGLENLASLFEASKKAEP